MDFPPVEQAGVGIVVPHDMALDRELWRWVPGDVSLHLTRTPQSSLAVTVEMVADISEPDIVARSVRDLTTTASQVYAYACTSGSFIRGTSGERELARAMTAAGAPAAVTTSGALLKALTALGVSRVAIATPYDDAITAHLEEFLLDAGVDVHSSANLGLVSGIQNVPYETTADLIRRADDSAAQAIFVSCTNLPTYDLIAALEAELDKPVITANQVTMWHSLQVIGRKAVGRGQRLLTH